MFCGKVFLKGYRDDDSITHTAQSRRIDTYKYTGVESTTPVALSFSTPVQDKGGKLCITVTEGGNSNISNGATNINIAPAASATAPATNSTPAAPESTVAAPATADKFNGLEVQGNDVLKYTIEPNKKKKHDKIRIAVTQ